MSTIIFYEKPGCANNSRQKLLLKNAGYTVIARDLLTEPWTRQRLREFFGDLPVTAWFNPAAPRIKSGEIVPEHFNAGTAITLMLTDTLLIRRPLMEYNNKCIAGFDARRVDDWLGMPLLASDKDDIQTCQRRETDAT